MVYIIVPVFKRLEKTIAFLESLQVSISDAYHVVLVDDSPEYEHFNFINGEINISVAKGNGYLYWGGGINEGLNYLNKKFIVGEQDIIIFANNDILLDKNAFTELNSLFKKDSNRILHPKLIDQVGNVISAGSKIVMWFPFITDHRINESSNLNLVDIASARFLMFSGKTLSILGGVNDLLPHYGGDNDFTYRAKKLGINTYIVSSAICYVDESETGEKASNMNGFVELLKSFKSIKSPNSIEYRYKFVSSHFNPIFSVAIVFSMTVKSVLAYLLKGKY